MNYDAGLKKRVDRLSTPVFLTTKAELVQHYRETSKGSWRKDIVGDLSKISHQKESTLQRRFDPSRLDKKASKKAQGEYAQLGKEIGPVGRKPPKGYEIYFVVDIKISGKCGNIRSHTETLTGPAAYEFSQNPSWDILMMLYFKGSVAENICKVYWDETRITPLT